MADYTRDNLINYCAKEREYYQCPTEETFEVWLKAWDRMNDNGGTGVFKPEKENIPLDQRKAYFRKEVEYEDNPTEDTFKEWMDVWEKLKDENPELPKPQKSH